MLTREGSSASARSDYHIAEIPNAALAAGRSGVRCPRSALAFHRFSGRPLPIILRTHRRKLTFHDVSQLSYGAQLPEKAATGAIPQSQQTAGNHAHCSLDSCCHRGIFRWLCVIPPRTSRILLLGRNGPVRGISESSDSGILQALLFGFRYDGCLAWTSLGLLASGSKNRTEWLLIAHGWHSLVPPNGISSRNCLVLGQRLGTVYRYSVSFSRSRLRLGSLKNARRNPARIFALCFQGEYFSIALFGPGVSLLPDTAETFGWRDSIAGSSIEALIDPRHAPDQPLPSANNRRFRRGPFQPQVFYLALILKSVS